MIAALAAIAVSCEKDGDRLTAWLDGEGTDAVTSFNDNIVITKENISKLILTLYWDESGSFSLNIPQASVPESILTNAIQFSSSPDFSLCYDHVLQPGSTAAQFTGGQLNVIISRLGLSPDVEHTLYIRLKTSLGTNTDPRYGPVTSVKATGFYIDMSVLKILSSDKGTVKGTIPASGDGQYKGFVYADSWMNFWFEEGDGNIWGTYNDGTSGTAFLMSSTGSAWNNWFPEPEGLYFVTMDTGTEEWSATYVGAVQAMAGETEIEMVSSSDGNLWNGIFTTQADNQEIRLHQRGNHYSKEGGDASYSEKTISFTGAGNGSLNVGEGELSSGLKTAAAGTYTLRIHLDKMKWELLEGEHEIESGQEPEIPVDPDPGIVYEEFLYCFYAWTSGDKWEVDIAARMWSETKNGVYIGYFSSADKWKESDSSAEPFTNFTFSTSDTPNDAEATRYGCDSSENLKLVTPPSSGWGCWVDNLGLTKLTVDMRTLSYSKYYIGSPTLEGASEAAFTFSLEDYMWTGTCVVANAGDSIRVVLGEDIYGGAAGKLIAGGPGIKAEEAGTYTIVLDLRDASNLTYTLTKDR